MYALSSVLNSLIEGTADINYLKNKTKFSESKIYGIIRLLREDSHTNGFEIITVRNEGYKLLIKDSAAFQTYLAELKKNEEGNSENKKKRTAFIIYFLICTQGYCTIDTIADTLGVHRKTITNSLKEVKKICKKYDLMFESKKHYGIKILGEELNVRRLFSSVITQISNTNHGIYKEFEIIKRDPHFQDFLANTLVRNNIILTSSALESFVLHISVLLLRVKENNHVTEITVDKTLISNNYYQAASDIIIEMQKKYEVSISSQEQDLIAAQLFGKAILEDVPVNTKAEMKNKIINTLSKIDSEYHTNYSEDNELAEGLLLHLYPLILRLTCNLELSNALFKTLPAQYTNAFIIAIRFIELHPELQNYPFSRDEIGYLALHFANYQERKNTHYIKRIRSIAFIYKDLRSESYLSKIKLENAFVNAKVKIIHQSKIHKYRLEDIDLVLATTSDLGLNIEPFIVNERIDDNEVERIKNAVIFNYHDIINDSIRVEDLFCEQLFFYEKNQSYLSILEKYAFLLEEKGYAKRGFALSVMEREKRLDTVYENGLAGPHSIVPLGNLDCILTIILSEAIMYNNKLVKCIFLINIREGHMVLHQGISQLIVRLMAEKEIVDHISTRDSFDEFMKIIQKN
jgi:lichenan operon transcriptional antiterminator